MMIPLKGHYHSISFLFLILSSNSYARDTDFARIAPELGIRADSAGECLKTKKEAREALLAALPNTQVPELNPDLKCLALKKHLHHDIENAPSLPLMSELLASKESGVKNIEGKIRYLTVDASPYRYTIRHDSKLGFDVDVKIFIHKWKIWSGSELNKLSEKERMDYLKRRFDLILVAVSNFWSNNSTGVRFHFSRTENTKDADFSITLDQSPGGALYNKFIDWWPDDIAKTDDEAIRGEEDFDLDAVAVQHEVGHMMGLEDEYTLSRTIFNIAFGWTKTLGNKSEETKRTIQSQTDVKNRGCDVTSIMCQDWETPTIKDYQVYAILRRWK